MVYTILKSNVRCSRFDGKKGWYWYMVVEKLARVTPGVYSVAWFKLAEFVTRKEKERAFGLYRLLSHSIADRAFAAQLEADLFMAFQDERALEMYQKAAVLYEQQQQLTHAALVYEQLMLLQPNNKEHAERAFKLYALLRNDMKVIRCARQLLTLLIKQSALRAVENFFLTLSENKLEIHDDLYETCVYALCEFHPERTDVIYSYLDPLLHYLTRNTDNPQRLSLFLAHLSHVRPEIHAYACERIALSPEEATA